MGHFEEAIKLALFIFVFPAALNDFGQERAFCGSQTYANPFFCSRRAGSLPRFS